MDEETITEVKEKIWQHELDETKIWGKSYLRIIVAENEASAWTYDDERIEAEVDVKGHLCIRDDNRWVLVHNKKALEIIRDAIDIAIRKQDEKE